ncbi:MAG: hypothetical protein ABSF87_16055 [Xanthobacteraceae bacterium]|jgi:hypothetical protein
MPTAPFAPAPAGCIEIADGALRPASRPIKSLTIMRAEIETIVAEIKQSVGLLRRHL